MIAKTEQPDSQATLTVMNQYRDSTSHLHKNQSAQRNTAVISGQVDVVAA